MSHAQWPQSSVRLQDSSFSFLDVSAYFWVSRKRDWCLDSGSGWVGFFESSVMSIASSVAVLVQFGMFSLLHNEELASACPIVGNVCMVAA